MRGNTVHLAKLKYNKQICTEVFKSSVLLARNYLSNNCEKLTDDYKIMWLKYRVIRQELHATAIRWCIQ